MTMVTTGGNPGRTRVETSPSHSLTLNLGDSGSSDHGTAARPGRRYAELPLKRILGALAVCSRLSAGFRGRSRTT